MQSALRQLEPSWPASLDAGLLAARNARSTYSAATSASAPGSPPMLVGSSVAAQKRRVPAADASGSASTATSAAAGARLSLAHPGACDPSDNSRLPPVVARTLPTRQSTFVVVNRAGTRGYRAPEVLLRTKVQTTAIDMWAVGVILLSIMTRRQVFFVSGDDQEALEEIACLTGNEDIAAVARAFGRKVTFSAERPRRTWKEIVTSLSRGFGPGGVTGLQPDSTVPPWPDAMYHLLAQLLEVNPIHRLTAADALQHPFFHDICQPEARASMHALTLRANWSTTGRSAVVAPLPIPAHIPVPTLPVIVNQPLVDLFSRAPCTTEAADLEALRRHLDHTVPAAASDEAAASDNIELPAPKRSRRNRRSGPLPPKPVRLDMAFLPFEGFPDDLRSELLADVINNNLED